MENRRGKFKENKKGTRRSGGGGTLSLNRGQGASVRVAGRAMSCGRNVKKGRKLPRITDVASNSHANSGTRLGQGEPFQQGKKHLSLKGGGESTGGSKAKKKSQHKVERVQVARKSEAHKKNGNLEEKLSENLENHRSTPKGGR